MPAPLSPDTHTLLITLFDTGDSERIAGRLEDEVSENIPMRKTVDPAGLERARFSIIKLVAENPAGEDAVFALAVTDWRDLLMAAGFGHDTDEHRRWCEAVLNQDRGRP